MIDPQDIDPDTGRPYPNYSDPCADDKAGLDWREEAYENGEEPCIDARGHRWVCSDENDDYCYCSKCGCSEY